MKKTFTGWIGKREAKEFCWEKQSVASELKMPSVYKRKETEHDWPESDWPPIKVEITVEILK